MAAMFDPVYVTEVLNDILSRRGLQIALVPKDSAPQSPADQSPKKESQPRNPWAASVSPGVEQDGRSLHDTLCIQEHQKTTVSKPANT